MGHWPEGLRQPLIKVVNDPAAKGPKAVASGVRSCLVKLDGRWYRLKGSGNNDEGFVVRTSQGADGANWRDIRGSAFAHTAMRENYMTAVLERELAHRGILGCNRAMGMYLYDPPNCPLGTDPDVRPACIVEETRGDRRLGTHVLAGVELLLPLLVSEEAVDEGRLLSLFPAGRPNSQSLTNLPATAELMYDNMVTTLATVPGLSMYPDVVWNAQSLCNLAGDAQGHLPEVCPDHNTYPAQWTNAGSRPMDPRWYPLWEAACHQLADARKALSQRSAKDGGAPPAVLPYLFSRIGVESGRFLRHLHALRISWATYQDGMCRRDFDEWHCNAHANNMVLLSEAVGLEEGSFLSYLDLDMAFDDATFVDAWAAEGALEGAAEAAAARPEEGAAGGTVLSAERGGRRGLYDAADGPPPAATESYDRLLLRESVNFMEVLAGGDTTNGVPMVAKATVESQGPILQAVKAGLYDTMMLGYLHGYHDDDAFPRADADLQLHKAAYAIVRMAIVVMADYVA